MLRPFKEDGMGSTPNDGQDPRIQRTSDRPRRKKVVVESAEAHVKELAALAELMLAAAWSDGNKVAVEIVAIAEQLKEFVETTSLPEHVSQRMGHFDPATFDVTAAVAELTLASDDDRVAVLNLLARVVGADRVVHPAEEAFMKKVASALGLDASTLQIEIG
jgi:uncharacterized tellurite resistance protein B-like protein